MDNFDRHPNLTEVDEKFRQAKFHLEFAAEAKEELRKLILNHPEHTLMRPGQHVRHIALCLLLVTPFFTDSIIEQHAIRDLLSKYLGVENGMIRALCTVIIVGVQTFLVWALSFFGRSRKGMSGLVTRAAGLLAAIFIPVMTVSTTLAQGDIATMESLADGKAGAALGWMTVVKENLQFVAFAFFSMAIHSLIWVEASDIPKSIEALTVARKFRALKAQVKRALSHADECEREGAALVIVENKMRESYEIEFRHTPVKLQSTDLKGREAITRYGHEDHFEKRADTPEGNGQFSHREEQPSGQTATYKGSNISPRLYTPRKIGHLRFTSS
jgi:hypothetical protein